jgi:hypothetical protein
MDQNREVINNIHRKHELKRSQKNSEFFSSLEFTEDLYDLIDAAVVDEGQRNNFKNVLGFNFSVMQLCKESFASIGKNKNIERFTIETLRNEEEKHKKRLDDISCNRLDNQH